MPLRISSSSLRNQSSLRLRNAVQHPLVSRSARALTPGRLRILAFHGVDDLDHFEASVRQIVKHYRPVSGDDIVAALNGERHLPKWSVWFTFDDGLKSTLDAGEMLAHHGIQATAFINPSTYAAPSLLWFQVLELAEEHDLIGDHESDRFARQRLKTCSDGERRAEIRVLENRLATIPDLPASVSGSVGELRHWVELGHEVGNHSWDHPCLDTCQPDEQRRQIAVAHEWLLSAGITPRFFAYPNGNWTSFSELLLSNLGYMGSLLFDHHLARLASTQRISRLRIDSDAEMRRVQSILSGTHSLGYAVQRCLRTASFQRQHHGVEQ